MPASLFDESHSEAWTIRPELAARMQPAHPGDSSLAAAAAALAERDFEVAAHTDRPADRRRLADADLLVIAHPSDPKWEATTSTAPPASPTTRSTPSSATSRAAAA